MSNKIENVPIFKTIQYDNGTVVGKIRESYCTKLIIIQNTDRLPK